MHIACDHDGNQVFRTIDPFRMVEGIGFRRREAPDQITQRIRDENPVMRQVIRIRKFLAAFPTHIEK